MGDELVFDSAQLPLKEFNWNKKSTKTTIQPDKVYEETYLNSKYRR